MNAPDVGVSYRNNRASTNPEGARSAVAWDDLTGIVRRVNHHPDREGTVEGGLVTPKQNGIGKLDESMLRSSGKASRGFAVSGELSHGPSAAPGHRLFGGSPGSAAQSARGDPKRFPPALRTRAPSPQMGIRPPEIESG